MHIEKAAADCFDDTTTPTNRNLVFTNKLHNAFHNRGSEFSTWVSCLWGHNGKSCIFLFKLSNNLSGGFQVCLQPSKFSLNFGDMNLCSSFVFFVPQLFDGLLVAPQAPACVALFSVFAVNIVYKLLSVLEC